MSEYITGLICFQGKPESWQPLAERLFDAWAGHLVGRGSTFEVMASTPSSFRPRDWNFSGDPRANRRSWEGLLQRLGTYNLVVGQTAPGIDSGGLQLAQVNYSGGPSPRLVVVGLSASALPSMPERGDADRARLVSLFDELPMDAPLQQAVVGSGTWFAPGGNVLRTPFEDRVGIPVRGGPSLRGLGSHLWLGAEAAGAIDQSKLSQVAHVRQTGQVLRLERRSGVSDAELAHALIPLVPEAGVSALG